MLKILLYCNDMTDFENQKARVATAGFGDLEFLFGSSGTKAREQLINENQNCWLLFLDHDCIPGTGTRLECDRLISEYCEQKPVVFAGVYENPPDANPLQMAHNQIANTWLAQSYSSQKAAPVLLGGNFLIYTGHEVKLPQQKFWGAEDKLLAKHLVSAGYKMQMDKKVKAIHSTSRSFRHFVRRAVLHGRHDAIYFGNDSGTKIFYWIQKTDFSDLRLMPLILLHFCIQKAAKTAQKILRRSRQKK